MTNKKVVDKNMSSANKQKYSAKFGHVMLIIVWLFLFTEYMLRVSDSAIIPELSKEFGINASGIGLLSSSYYFIYAVMQIPAGLLLDRFGLTKLLSAAIFVLAISALLMGSSPDFSTVIIARLLMGASSAFAFIGGLKIIAVYLNTNRRSLWVGITMTIATLGAVSGQEPWLLLTKAMGDWRYVYYLLGVIVLLIALWAFLLPTNKSSDAQRDVIKSKDAGVTPALIRQKLSDGSFTSLLIYIGFLSAPITVFAAFWAIPFFYQGLGINRDMATSLSSLSWIGGLFGGPLLGFLADYFHMRKRVLVVAGFSAAVIVLLVLFCAMPPVLIAVLFFILGVFCNAHVVIFAEVSETVPKYSVGFFMGLINTCNILATPILQLLVGIMLSWEHIGVEQNGQEIYRLVTYQKCLVIIPALLILATIYVIWKLKPLSQTKA